MTTSPSFRSFHSLALATNSISVMPRSTSAYVWRHNKQCPGFSRARGPCTIALLIGPLEVCGDFFFVNTVSFFFYLSHDHEISTEKPTPEALVQTATHLFWLLFQTREGVNTAGRPVRSQSLASSTQTRRLSHCVSIIYALLEQFESSR